MKKGFTLVELSIVLVVIGLLIGGILVGQSLINSAKIQAFIRELAQYDVSVMTFQSKYKGLPGDAKSMGGDGDNILVDASCSMSPTSQRYTCRDGFSGEIAKFWSDLSISGLMKKGGGVYKDDSASAYGLVTSGENQTVPVLPLGFETVAVAFTDLGEDQGEVDNAEYSKHFYQIFGRASQLGTASATVPTLTSIEAAAIDAKLDDGKPLVGDVLVQGLGTSGEMGSLMSTSTCPSGTSYNTSAGDAICALAIKMMVSK